MPSSPIHAVALARFMAVGFHAPEWEVDAAAAEPLVLTDAGRTLCEGLQEVATPEVPLSALRLAVFAQFLQDDLLVDVDASDLEPLWSELDQAIREGNLRFPALFNPDLFERYDELVGGYRERLTPNESRELLTGTAQGVCQIGDVLAGPLGLTRSAQLRWLPPAPIGLFLRCQDPGCSGLHGVFLTDDSPFKALLAELAFLNANAGINPMGWETAFQELAVGNLPYMDDMNRATLPLLLTNAFTASELLLLTETLLAAGGALRSRLPTTNAFRGSPQEIASQLDRQEALQVVLLTADEEIVTSIEMLLDSGRLTVPTTEVRTPVLGRSDIDNGWYEVHAELSALGLRFEPSRTSLSASRLRRLLLSVFRDEPDDLNWILRQVDGTSREAKVEKFVQEADPEVVLRQLVLTSRTRLVKALHLVGPGHLNLPVDTKSEEALVRRMLWKLGFDRLGAPSYLPLFWHRLRALQDVLSLADEPYGETQREALRAEGVNLFVSLEEVLDYSLAFATWTLLADPWENLYPERFVFILSKARLFATEQLAGRSVGGTNVLELDAAGKNTLYPLAEGLGVLAEKCAELLDRGSAEFERSPDAFPSWATETNLMVFPFRHTLPLFDIGVEERAELITTLRNVPADLQRGRVLDVRNRLEHLREDFPTRRDIEVACQALHRTISGLEELGICPSVYRRRTYAVDSDGRSTATLTDYKNSVVVLNRPSVLDLCGMPPALEPQVVMHGATIAGTGEIMRYRFREDSEFRDLWMKYPRRYARSDGDTGLTGDHEEAPS